MSIIARTLFTLLFALLFLSTVIAQTPRETELPIDAPPSRKQPSTQSATVIVTATASSQRVRYVSMGEVRQTRLQVFSVAGAQVFDSDFKLGNLIDWQLTDQQGLHLTDGSYLFLITVKDFSGNLTQKYGAAVLEQEQVYLEQISRDGLTSAQATVLESSREAKALSPVDRIGAAGLNRTAAAASSDSKPTSAAISTQTTSTNAVSQQPTTGGENISGTGAQNSLAKWTDNAGSLGNSNIFENASGRIGIGTTTPETGLEVKANNAGAGGFFVGNASSDPSAFSEFGLYNNLGTGSRAQFYMRSSTYVGGDGASSFNIYTNTTAPINIGTNSVPRLRIESNGNVGIGTTTPATNLEVKANNAGTGGFFVGNISNNPSAFSEFGLYNDLGVSARAQFYMRSSTYGGADGANSFNIYTNAAAPINIGTGGVPRLRIDSSGRVGIGTTNPQSKLDVAGAVNVTGDISVAGNALVSGNIAAKYQDVAEWVPSQHKLAAGTVVILDATRTNAVAPSYRAYDTHLAGVVSAQPGVILGEGGTGKVMVATTGRVMVKVDASSHPIKIGDLLVTSNRPGVAMRSQPIRVGRTLIHRPGTIIGKALATLTKGEGEILVLLSLQ